MAADLLLINIGELATVIVSGRGAELELSRRLMLPGDLGARWQRTDV